MEVSSHTVYVLFNNCKANNIKIPRESHLGSLISQKRALTTEFSQHPSKPLSLPYFFQGPPKNICQAELTDDTHLSVYTISSQPVTESNQHMITMMKGLFDNLAVEEPYPGFNAQLLEILNEADTLHNDADRQELHKVLYK